MDEIIRHGRSYIWDMEIDSYKDVYLEDFYDDTIIDFEYLHCEEMYVGERGLQRYKPFGWIITVPIKFKEINKALKDACRELSMYDDFLVDYIITDEPYIDSELTILIKDNMSIFDAFNYAIEMRDVVIEYAKALDNKSLSKVFRQTLVSRLPIYSRAMRKIELELSNFTTDESANSKKIIEISSRVKTVDSIQEKVYRKNICQFELFDKFDDIAGVRCTCEFLSDVYDVVEYISENPLINVQSIEDKIENPAESGYRGIHIIATTDVYYQGSIYENVKVEIQIRTAFQNAWSMKTHQLTYKREDDIPNDISETMRKMSDSLNEADKSAQLIRDKLRNI